MEQVIIRRATLEDLGALLDFEQAIIETERPMDATIRTGPDVLYYDLAELISLPNAHVVVAELGSAIIASGYARIDPSEPYYNHDKHSYLGFMYVVPEHRGKGINRLIVDALETWSRSHGVMELRLEVYVENTGAMRAYEKTGYEPLILTMQKALNDRTRVLRRQSNETGLE